MDTLLKASIGPKVNPQLEKSPQGDDGTNLFKNVIITLSGQRCITEVGDDSVEVRRQSVMTADIGPWSLLTSTVKCTDMSHVALEKVKKSTIRNPLKKSFPQAHNQM